MLKIFGDREYFYQWDLDQKLVVEDDSVIEVHFSNFFTDVAYVVEVKDGLVEVPNILLQENLEIRAYGYCGKCHTLFEKTFEVKYKTQPADYVYTETEVKSYEALEKKIESTEKRISSAFQEIETLQDKNESQDEAIQMLREQIDSAEFAADWNSLEGKPAINAGGGSNSVVIGKSTVATGGSALAAGHSAKAIPYTESNVNNKHIIRDDMGNVDVEAYPALDVDNSKGNYASAIGYNCEAWGNYSHAVGSSTVAGARYAHAEGNSTVAMARGAHSEGEHTEALGRASHAEGEYTVAHAPHQHVQGKYNVVDEEGNYAHIVGWGTSSKPANIHTLTTTGDAWYQGGIEANSLALKKSDGKYQTFTADTLDKDVRTLSVKIGATAYTFTAEDKAILQEIWKAKECKYCLLFPTTAPTPTYYSPAKVYFSATNYILFTFATDTYSQSIGTYTVKILFNSNGTVSTATTTSISKKIKDWIWVEERESGSVDVSGHSLVKVVGYWNDDVNDTQSFDIATSFGNDFSEEEGAKYRVNNGYFFNEQGFLYFMNNDGEDYTSNGWTFLGFYYWGVE